MAAVVAKSTALAPVKPVPVTVTRVPPEGRPATGLTEVTAGAASKVKSSAEEVALVPTGVVTVTSIVPAGSAGEVTVIEVGEMAVMVPAVVPKSTALAPGEVGACDHDRGSPAARPATGLTALTVGTFS